MLNHNWFKNWHGTDLASRHFLDQWWHTPIYMSPGGNWDAYESINLSITVIHRNLFLHSKLNFDRLQPKEQPSVDSLKMHSFINRTLEKVCLYISYYKMTQPFAGQTLVQSQSANYITLRRESRMNNRQKKGLIHRGPFPKLCSVI